MRWLDPLIAHTAPEGAEHLLPDLFLPLGTLDGGMDGDT